MTAVSGCHDRAHDEAAAVLRAIDLARDAPPTGKRGPADALAALPAEGADVREARDLCTAAFRHFADGIETQTRVTAEIERLERDAGAAREDGGLRGRVDALGIELGAAELSLAAAKTSLEACESAIDRMRARHRL